MALVGAGIIGALSLALAAPAQAGTAKASAPLQPPYCGWKPANNSHAPGTYLGTTTIRDGQSTSCNQLGIAADHHVASIGCYIDTTSGRWYFASDLATGLTGWSPAGGLNALWNPAQC
jgi:hypothetical protein